MLIHPCDADGGNVDEDTTRLILFNAHAAVNQPTKLITQIAEVIMFQPGNFDGLDIWVLTRANLVPHDGVDIQQLEAGEWVTEVNWAMASLNGSTSTGGCCSFTFAAADFLSDDTVTFSGSNLEGAVVNNK